MFILRYNRTKKYPLCHSCGAIRYPVENNIAVSRQQKLKLSVSVAAAIITPGAFVVLALMGANHISTKIKNQKI
ncbi:hypothetical protein BMR02_05855 [Methylococcaceae bacterium HT1]|nr:hypothetical protein BMR02_05855 [Methylococcaceae bacterium HT1]TXL17263.1 hypothetical protein BMR04_06395 [Methylococcaceae bacterium HT3]TXL23462.1 hypothetical protein BMR03_02070 [Methylococcaceae bacterium HT2]TXL23466.1 hypothetical protein BMR03_02095 [Methylococcaceae bacterium HT2]